MEDTWTFDVESAETAKGDVTDPFALKKWDKYEADVTADPFFHPKPRRISKIAGTSFPEGSYRYRDDPLRVVYFPNRTSKTVVTLSAGSATDIKYKKRSYKKQRKPI